MSAASPKREAFYQSTTWRKCAKDLRALRHHTCEKCGKPGWLVHHIVPLTDETVDDSNIALNPDNLMLLCSSCHDAIHHHIKGHGSKGSRHVDLKFDANGNAIVSEKEHT